MNVYKVPSAVFSMNIFNIAEEYRFAHQYSQFLFLVTFKIISSTNTRPRYHLKRRANSHKWSDNKILIDNQFRIVRLSEFAHHKIICDFGDINKTLALTVFKWIDRIYTSLFQSYLLIFSKNNLCFIKNTFKIWAILSKTSTSSHLRRRSRN